MKAPFIALVAVLTLQPICLGEEAPSLDLAAAVGQPQQAVRLARMAEQMTIPSSNTLPEAWIGAADQLTSMRARNAAGMTPVQIGFTRKLAVPLLAHALTFESSAEGRLLTTIEPFDLVLSTRLKVAGATRLRLHLERISAPVGTTFTVWSPQGPPQTVGVEALTQDGSIWMPSTEGDQAFLEIRYPRIAGRQLAFDLQEVAEIFSDAPTAGECLIDATCISSGSFSSIETLRKAIAHIEYLNGSSLFVCSGGLLNDTDATTVVPYFLTANHCVSSQAEASTLEAFWDYKTTSCGGSFPSLATLPKSVGSTLLASSVQSDFTLLRLASIPAGRALLGWTTAALSNGSPLSRVSHPVPNSLPFPQSFSGSLYSSNPTLTCPTDSDGRPWGNLSKFLYSTPATGGTYPGSSGSPAVNAAGQVVGQLLGACGPVLEGCSTQHYTVDGAFAATFPSISQYLNPAPAGGPCVRDANTACLQNDRFEAKVTYTNDGGSGNASVMSFGGQRAENTETAFYYFTSATNFEMGLKVLDACGINNKFWIFISGLTDQGWTATIRDTQTGATKTYSNANHHLSQTVADTAALACH